MKLLKQEDKNIILARDHRTPILRKRIDLKEVKDKKGANLRLFTSNPGDLDGSLQDIHIICHEEYEMILRGDVDSTLLDQPEELSKFRETYWLKLITEYVSGVPEDYKIMYGGVPLDISQVTCEHNL